MKSKDLAMLLALAAMWGSSFLFIRIGALALGPYVLIFLRVAIAGAALLLYALLRRQRPQILRRWRPFLILGLFNAAIPFTLISVAELQISASLAAVLNATTPLFTALAARFWMGEALTPKKIAGLLLGIFGVAVLVGWDPQQSGDRHMISVAFSLLAAISYAVAGLYSARTFREEKPLDMAIGQQLSAALFMLPFAAFTIPDTAPTTLVTVSVLTLSLMCTALAYLLFFALLHNVGPVRTLSVTFMVPVFGVVWGAVFLSEPLSLPTSFGFALILLSVVLVLNIPLGRVRKEGRPRIQSVTDKT